MMALKRGFWLAMLGPLLLLRPVRSALWDRPAARDDGAPDNGRDR